jgi:hypothetical protein
MWERRCCVEDGVEIRGGKVIEVCLYKQPIMLLDKGQRRIGGVSVNLE